MFIFGIFGKEVGSDLYIEAGEGGIVYVIVEGRRFSDCVLDYVWRWRAFFIFEGGFWFMKMVGYVCVGIYFI